MLVKTLYKWVYDHQHRNPNVHNQNRCNPIMQSIPDSEQFWTISRVFSIWRFNIFLKAWCYLYGPYNMGEVKKMANKTIPHQQNRITAIIRFNLIAYPIKTHFNPFSGFKSFNLIFTMIWALFLNIKSGNFLIFSKQFVSVSEKYLIFVSLDSPLMVCLLKWLIPYHFLWHCNSAGM